jgi:hypothetical protein
MYSHGVYSQIAHNNDVNNAQSHMAHCAMAFRETRFEPIPSPLTVPTEMNLSTLGPSVSQQRVERRIEAILGFAPSRSDLISITSRLGWGPLSREEKRAKVRLIAKLESRATEILAMLETKEGIHSLETAYVEHLRDQGQKPPLASVQAPGIDLVAISQPPKIPPEASISFYMNMH